MAAGGTGVAGQLASALRRSNVPDSAQEQQPPAPARSESASAAATARVTSRRGALEAKAQITPRSDIGMVFMNFHFHEAAVNLVTNPALDPVGKIPELKVCAVRVEVA